MDVLRTVPSGYMVCGLLEDDNVVVVESGWLANALAQGFLYRRKICKRTDVTKTLRQNRIRPRHRSRVHSAQAVPSNAELVMWRFVDSFVGQQ